MKKSIAMKWVAALRSGKYKQVTGTLKKDNSYCCLGVLCDLSKMGKWEDGDYTLPSMYNEDGVIERSHGVPSRSIVEWSEMSDSNPALSELTSLATLNDDGLKDYSGLNNHLERFTFDEIADLIQINYEEL